jgi:hypothetical protein
MDTGEHSPLRHENKEILKGISLSAFAWDENEGRQEPPPTDTLRINKNSQVVRTDKEGKAIFHIYVPMRIRELTSRYEIGQIDVRLRFK